MQLRYNKNIEPIIHFFKFLSEFRTIFIRACFVRVQLIIIFCGKTQIWYFGLWSHFRNIFEICRILSKLVTSSVFHFINARWKIGQCSVILSVKFIYKYFHDLGLKKTSIESLGSARCLSLLHRTESQW